MGQPSPEGGGSPLMPRVIIADAFEIPRDSSARAAPDRGRWCTRTRSGRDARADRPPSLRRCDLGLCRRGHGSARGSDGWACHSPGGNDDFRIGAFDQPGMTGYGPSSVPDHVKQSSIARAKSLFRSPVSVSVVRLRELSDSPPDVWRTRFLALVCSLFIMAAFTSVETLATPAQIHWAVRAEAHLGIALWH